MGDQKSTEAKTSEKTVVSRRKRSSTHSSRRVEETREGVGVEGESTGRGLVVWSVETPDPTRGSPSFMRVRPLTDRFSSPTATPSTTTVATVTRQDGTKNDRSSVTYAHQAHPGPSLSSTYSLTTVFRTSRQFLSSPVDVSHRTLVHRTSVRVGGTRAPEISSRRTLGHSTPKNVKEDKCRRTVPVPRQGQTGP